MGKPKKAAVKKVSKPRLKVAEQAAAALFKPSSAKRVPKKEPPPEEPKIEVSVRSVYYDGQFLPALCFRKPGAQHVPCVAGTTVTGVWKFTIPVSQHDRSVVLQHGFGNFAAPYSAERFAAHMKTVATTVGIVPEARALLLPYCPDMPSGQSAQLTDTIAYDAAAAAQKELSGAADRVAVTARSRPPSGPARTSGKELIRVLAAASGLPPEKVRAKLRAAGMRAPYTDEAGCRKALGVKS